MSANEYLSQAAKDRKAAIIARFEGKFMMTSDGKWHKITNGTYQVNGQTVDLKKFSISTLRFIRAFYPPQESDPTQAGE